MRLDIKKRASVLLVLSLLIVGCHKVTVTQTPPGVNPSTVQQWYAATGALVTISDLARAGVAVLKELHDNKVVDDEYYYPVITSFGKISYYGLSAVSILRQSPNTFTAPIKTQVFNLVNNIITEAQNITNSKTAVKDPTSIKTVDAILSSMAIAVALVRDLTGGK